MSDKKPKNPNYSPGELKGKLGGGMQGSQGQSQPRATRGDAKKGGLTGSKDPGGYSGSYKKRKKVTAKGHTLQSQKRADRLAGRQFMKRFTGKSRKTILV